MKAEDDNEKDYLVFFKYVIEVALPVKAKTKKMARANALSYLHEEGWDSAGGMPSDGWDSITFKGVVGVQEDQ